jgi:hypothetical protein
MGKEGDDAAGKWCILRMSGPSTMRLVASLQDAGLEVWTPTEHIKRRVPRGKGSEHLAVPMAPTYAFARGRHLPDLQRITRMDVSPHPRFSIFRYYGETVFVRHAELHRLRAQQQRSYVATLPTLRRHAGKPRGEAFEVGEAVTFESGPLTGLQCFVEASDGLNTTLSLSLFGRITKTNVATLQLRSHNVPEQKHAA